MSPSKVRQCPNCGSFVVTDQEFCPRCDAKLDSAPSPAEPVDQWLPPAPDEPELPTITDAPPPELPEVDPMLDLLPDEPTALLADEPLTLDDTHHDRLPTERLLIVDEGEQAEEEDIFVPLSAEERTLVSDSDPEPPTFVGEAFEEEIEAFPEEEPTLQDTSPRLKMDEPPTDPHDFVTQDYAAATMFRPTGEITPARQYEAPREMPRSYIVPPAPYTPPPVPVPIPMPAPPPIPQTMPQMSPPPNYGPAARTMSGTAYLQQRVQAYQRAGYQIEVGAPYEAALKRGKPLSFQAWLLALLSIIGFVWYLLIQMMSGFGKDHVYVTLEPDGRVYEDGPGAAHIRRQRSRTGRRWSIFGLVLFSISLIVLLILAGIGAGVMSQDRYQYALRKAYPAVSLFEDRLRSGDASDADIKLMKDGAVVFSIVGGIGLLGLWGGATLFVVGAVHASAYRSKVPPLPGYA